jgi:hypothetical protein
MEMDHAVGKPNQPTFDRRVFQREFERVLGCRTTWFRSLELRGAIPPARRDPGGKRKWWYASEVERALQDLGRAAAERNARAALAERQSMTHGAKGRARYAQP